MFSRLMFKFIFKLKTKIINNENKNRLINLDLLDTFIKKHNFTLVDAGCGKGTNLGDIILKYPNAKIIGIDNFKPDLDDAKKRFPNEIDFLHCDCLDMKINSKSVDIVISNQVIEQLQQKYNFVGALSFHSYSELVLWPWSYTDSITSKDHSVFEYYGKQLAKILNYRPMQSADLYPAAGDSDDYLYAMHGVLAYTVELGRRFVPQESEVPKIIAKNNKAMRWFFLNARDPFAQNKDTPMRKAQAILEKLIYLMHQNDELVDLHELLTRLNTLPQGLIAEAMQALNMKQVWRFRIKRALLQNSRTNQVQP